MSDAADRRRLEAVYALFKKIEHESEDGLFPPGELQELSRRLIELQYHPQIEISKLADIVPHLREDMTLRTFVNFLVPVERALRKNVQDDDILILDRDRQVIPRKTETIPLRLVLDQIRSAFNVGSILRTADGLGLEKVHLTGYTPTPLEDKTARTALGAQAVVDWDHSDDIKALLGKLKQTNWRIVAFETTDSALDLAEPFQPVPTVFIFGNERFGLQPDLLALCDEIRCLPMQGRKNSLNVGVMAAIASYEWKRQWKP